MQTRVVKQDFITQPGIYPIPDNEHFSVGKTWKENKGRQRTATIKEIHRVGFSEMPPVILEVTAVEDGKRFAKQARVVGWQVFLKKWSPVP